MCYNNIKKEVYNIKELNCTILESQEEINKALYDRNFVIEMSIDFVRIIRLAKCNVEDKEVNLEFSLNIFINNNNKSLSHRSQRISNSKTVFNKNNKYFLISDENKLKSIIDVLNFYGIDVNAYDKDVIEYFLVNYCYDVLSKVRY